jgi:hypothetical protein
MGDFNTDGKLEAAVIKNNLRDIAIFYRNRDGTFQPAVTYPASTGVDYLTET